MNRITTTAIALAAGIVVVTGASGVLDGASASATGTLTHASSAAKPATKGTITIENYGFSGPGKTLAPGALVTVKNRDSVTHTVTSNSAHKFNVRIGAHQTKTFRAPRKAGTYRFHCSIHTEMHGSLKVK
jgi:plastocyanin